MNSKDGEAANRQYKAERHRLFDHKAHITLIGACVFPVDEQHNGRCHASICLVGMRLE